jgi:hypothetical protein
VPRKPKRGGRNAPTLLDEVSGARGYYNGLAQEIEARRLLEAKAREAAALNAPAKSWMQFRPGANDDRPMFQVTALPNLTPKLVGQPQPQAYQITFWDEQGRRLNSIITQAEYDVLQRLVASGRAVDWSYFKESLFGARPAPEEPPAERVMPQQTISEAGISRLRNLVKRWVPGNGAPLGDRGRMINMGEITELCEAVPALLDEVERLRDSPLRANLERATAEAASPALDNMRRQIKSQAQTIDELRKERDAALRMYSNVNYPVPLSRRDPRFYAQVDNDELNEGGPVTPPNNLHQDMRDSLRELARRNTPQQGAEMNIREVALLVLSVFPLIDEIERLDEIIASALTCQPCHNTDHVRLHALGDLCEDQLSMMGVRLVQALNLPPKLLPRQLHDAVKCATCRGKGPVVLNWLLTGKLLDPNWEATPEYTPDDVPPEARVRARTGRVMRPDPGSFGLPEPARRRAGLGRPFARQPAGSGDEPLEEGTSPAPLINTLLDDEDDQPPF